MSVLVVKVASGLSRWSYEDLVLPAVGEHEVDVTDQPGLASAVAAACAAGVLVHVKGNLPKGAVESDEDSLKKQARAEKARTPLYAERDAELSAAHLADHAEIIERWEAKMAAAAQAELEG